MSSFGDGLKREREKKKITLDQVAVSTKISVRMLRAIEDEKFDQLPGGIFNKGFVRAYARHLGMDEDKAVADYLAASTPASEAPPEDLELRAMAEQKQKERQRQASLKTNFPWGAIAAVLLMVALAFSIWGVISGRETQSGNAAVKSVTAQPALAEGSTTAPKAAEVVTTVPASSRKQQPNPELKGDSHDKDGEMEVTTRHFLQDEPAKPVSPPAVKPGSFTLLVTAQENSWLSITADGNPIFTGTLIAPGVELVHATNSVVLRAGNLGGLEIDFNGKRLPRQGAAGEAKTLMFHSDGLELATPSTPPQAMPPKPAGSSENRE